jgi:hypothetical protein
MIFMFNPSLSPTANRMQQSRISKCISPCQHIPSDFPFASIKAPGVCNPAPDCYHCAGQRNRTEQGGAFTLQVDDLKATDPINLYQPPPIRGLFETAAADAALTAGPHVLKFVSLPPDERAKGKRLLLDKLHVSEVKE